MAERIPTSTPTNAEMALLDRSWRESMSRDTLDTDRIVQLLLRDAIATLGEGARAEVLSVAANFAEIARSQMPPRDASPDWEAAAGVSLAEAQRFFDLAVVDNFQQDVQDSFWDTTWPACPRHPNHPLSYSGDREAWCCPRDGSAVAPLGGLAGLRGPAT
jgi:hypothetical protein